uniref:Uncharacterized protein n=1 Tax=Periophthalmus magnuspinnatus TaxID=409849 RepID=A0A3B4A9K2_9GOBI
VFKCWWWLEGPMAQIGCLASVSLSQDRFTFVEDSPTFMPRCLLLLSSQMGLGKTVQAIAVAYSYRQEWPLLVVVPSSLKYPWIEELERWVPELKPGDINLVENKSHTMGISSSKVTVLGYGLLTSDARALVEALSRQKFAVVVVDESHYLKSRNAARTKILVPLIQKAKRAILLTGTPALGRPEEVWKLICHNLIDKMSLYLCPTLYFGSRRQWDCRGASNLDELHKQLSQVMIRRLKRDVLTQLPPKIRQRIPFDLPKDAAKEAASSFAEWERLMKGMGSKAVTTDNSFAEVMGLVTQMYKQTAVAKAGAVKDYIKMLLEDEHLKFLVFAHHLTMLQACTEAAIEAKAGYIRIDGSVPSSERIQLVHRFQSDPATRVAILSIQAAGQGLTFTAASHVVFAELYWNPGHMKQAEDRAHRIGQTCSVNVHYLIAKGTFDGVLWGMLNRKETVTGSTLNGRKEYLNAREGDKDKWDFLNFASAWTPSEMVLPPGGDSKNVSEDVFFTHFEKNKQHDIRTFFSPNTSNEKKRKRLENESTPQSNQTSPTAEVNLDFEENITTPEDDFSPQQKKLKTPHAAPSPVSRFGAKRRATVGGGGVKSPPVSVPTRRRLTVSGSSGIAWNCQTCTYSNSGLLPYCEMCEAPRHTVMYNKCTVKSLSLPLFSLSLFSPFFLLSSALPPSHLLQEGSALDCSFIPLDVQVNNWDELPPVIFVLYFFCFRLGQVMRFVQEWSALTAMKQKLLRRSGILFHSPGLGLQQLTSSKRPHASTKRSEVTRVALNGKNVHGSTSILIQLSETQYGHLLFSRCEEGPSKPTEDQPRPELSYVQAVDSSGVPLCLSCHQPCSTSGGAWDTRFCSHKCQEDFQLRSSQSYMRSRVLEVEQGVCQLCGLQAHQLYLRVRDAPPSQRKNLLDNTWLAQLPLNKLNEMIRAPVEGDFWQVDHITPVYSGGGQCSLDNLQTLCTVCHRQRTAQQAKERSQIKKTTAASKIASDITKFFMKK